MTAQPQVLKIRRPDDWHIHLRDDEMLKTVVPYTSQVFGRAIVMPNLVPPVTTVAAARAYRDRILAAVPQGHNFTPLMTCYLTNSLAASELINGFEQGVFTAAKLYPANATTNSSHGVSDVTGIYPLFEQMQKIGMPLLIHGEVTDPAVDIFDREARFIEQVMEPIRRHFPELKIVFEHITTKEAAQYVQAGNRFLGATITPQHLMFNRNHMLVGGIRPHLFCLPILKRNVHQEALRQAVASGSDRFFLGTDSAPHLKHRKESSQAAPAVSTHRMPSRLTPPFSNSSARWSTSRPSVRSTARASTACLSTKTSSSCSACQPPSRKRSPWAMSPSSPSWPAKP